MIKDRKALLVFLLPSLAGFMVFYVIPFIGGFYYCFVNNAIERSIVGFDNFFTLFKNEAFLLALRNTIFLAVVTVPMMIAVSFSMALLIKTYTGRGNIFRNIAILPLAVPTASVALIWYLMFKDNGFINRILNLLTGAGGVNWMNSSLLYIPVIMIYIWKYAGFNIILFLGGLTMIPKELHEAASIDGAGLWVRIRKITLPYIFPITFFVTVLSIINSFKIFKEVYVLYGAYPPQSVYLLQHFINNNFTKLNYERLTTAAYVFAILIMILVSILMHFERKIVSDQYLTEGQ